MAQRPLWYDPAVQQQPQVQPQQVQPSNLAAALMARQQPLRLDTPSVGISPSAMQKFADAFKTDPNAPSPYAKMTPAEMAAQTASVQPFGAAGTPSAAYNSPSWLSDATGWLSRLFGGGGG